MTLEEIAVSLSEFFHKPERSVRNFLRWKVQLKPKINAYIIWPLSPTTIAIINPNTRNKWIIGLDFVRYDTISNGVRKQHEAIQLILIERSHIPKPNEPNAGPHPGSNKTGHRLPPAD